jgi:hypothetical protein
MSLSRPNLPLVSHVVRTGLQVAVSDPSVGRPAVRITEEGTDLEIDASGLVRGQPNIVIMLIPAAVLYYYMGLHSYSLFVYTLCWDEDASSYRLVHDEDVLLSQRTEKNSKYTLKWNRRAAPRSDFQLVRVYDAPSTLSMNISHRAGGEQDRVLPATTIAAAAAAAAAAIRGVDTTAPISHKCCLLTASWKQERVSLQMKLLSTPTERSVSGGILHSADFHIAERAVVSFSLTCVCKTCQSVRFSPPSLRPDQMFKTVTAVAQGEPAAPPSPAEEPAAPPSPTEEPGAQPPPAEGPDAQQPAVARPAGRLKRPAEPASEAVTRGAAVRRAASDLFGMFRAATGVAMELASEAEGARERERAAALADMCVAAMDAAAHAMRAASVAIRHQDQT